MGDRTAIVAIGGNSLIKDKMHESVPDQYIAVHEIPLDVCGADSQGAIGYALAQNLQNELRRRGISKPVAAVVTQTEVARDDPAFADPSKPIGSFMDAAEATRRRTQDGWDLVEDANRGYRRVVASPRPVRIVELDAIRTLTDAGTVV